MRNLRWVQVACWMSETVSFGVRSRAQVARLPIQCSSHQQSLEILTLFCVVDPFENLPRKYTNAHIYTKFFMWFLGLYGIFKHPWSRVRISNLRMSYISFILWRLTGGLLWTCQHLLSICCCAGFQKYLCGRRYETYSSFKWGSGVRQCGVLVMMALGLGFAGLRGPAV